MDDQEEKTHFEDRLKRIEQEHRKFQLITIGTGVGLFLFVVILIGVLMPTRDPIEVRSIYLKGDVVEYNAELISTEQGTHFTLYGQDGRPMISSDAMNNQSRLDLVSPTTQSRATIGVSEKGSGFVLYDEEGRARAAFTVTKEGPELNFYDEEGEVSWRADSVWAVPESDNNEKVSHESPDTTVPIEEFVKDPVESEKKPIVVKKVEPVKKKKVYKKKKKKKPALIIEEPPPKKQEKKKKKWTTWGKIKKKNDPKNDESTEK
jgi:hypothetical protein